MGRWVWCVLRKAGSNAAKTYGQSTWLFFFLCRNGGVQLGCHPECLHHCPVRLRPNRPHLCQAACHEAETAQPEDIQPEVKQCFWKGALLFFGSWYSPCCASGSIQLQALLPFGEGDFGRMRLRLSGAVCGHLYTKEAKQRGIWLDCALVTGFVNSYEPLEPVLTTTAFLSILSSVLPGNSETVLRFCLGGGNIYFRSPFLPLFLSSKYDLLAWGFLYLVLAKKQFLLCWQSDLLIKNWLHLWATQMGIWKFVFH